eukprot:m.103995 g.103995  ORF g.103995 m.103995 type:complete len:986 (-) comp8873_c0_seq1:47-3004(-)
MPRRGPHTWSPPTAGHASDAMRPAAVSIYPYPHDPFENPQVPRYHTKTLSRTVLGNATRFAALRGFGVDASGNVTGYDQDLDLYTVEFQLADVIWPAYGFLYGLNLDDVLQSVRRRGIIVTDIWDYVPGDKDNCTTASEVCEFKITPKMFESLTEILDELWTGMDVGEQDGRYIGRFAPEVLAGLPRGEQYLAFFRHFDRMAMDLGDRLTALTSLYMPHYLLKPGLYTMVASETAQGLPNAQLFMAFNRGAGKQYAIWWWANVSVYNRFGYKSYPDHPTDGTSLSLMKRLMYSQIMYNSAFVSYESGWTEASGARTRKPSPLTMARGSAQILTPIGDIQQAARAWVARNNGVIGVHLATVALMLDFEAGWNPPRHLYTDQLFRVWGALPYGPGDHLTHALFDLFYPGYADSSYFHNERGFQAPTPFGDAVDVLLSDAPEWLLPHYSMVVLAGNVGVHGSAELGDKLTTYALGGGTVVLTAGTLANFPDGLLGASTNLTDCADYPANTVVDTKTGTVVEQTTFQLCSCSVTQGEVIANVGPRAAAWRVAYGQGAVVVLASPFGIASEKVTSKPITSQVDVSLPTPFPLLGHVSQLLGQTTRNTSMIFDLGQQLTFSVNSVGPDNYTVAVFNPDYEEHPLVITPVSGTIAALREIAIPDSERNATGYLPAGSEHANLGNDTATTIAGGSVRIFSITLTDSQIKPAPHVAPPPRPTGRGLFVLDGPLHREVLTRPTFFDHYDTLVADWRWVAGASAEALAADARFVGLQNFSLAVDLSSGLNLYPDMRIVKNALDDYTASMQMIYLTINKTAALGGKHVIVSYHIFPENWYSDQQSLADMLASLQSICAYAAPLGITIHLRQVANKPPSDLPALLLIVRQAGASNLRLALSTGQLIAQGTPPSAVAAAATQISMLFVGCPASDPLTDQILTVASPLATCDAGALASVQALLAAAPAAVAVPEAAMLTRAQEYAEAAILARIAGKVGRY